MLIKIKLREVSYKISIPTYSVRLTGITDCNNTTHRSLLKITAIEMQLAASTLKASARITLESVCDTHPKGGIDC